MSAISSLSEEHAIFRALIDRVERAFQYDEETARKELRVGLLVLLPALGRHDEVEELVFSNGPKSVVRLVSDQHRKIADLRGEVSHALQTLQGHEQFDALKTRVQALMRRLRAHFETEELRLWPYYRGPNRRSIPLSVQTRARRTVSELKREVEHYQLVVGQYL